MSGAAGGLCPAIFGLSGLQLTTDEVALFGDCNPAGFILFSRNIADPVQLRRLTDDLRSLSGRDDLPILIDQEGGAVARLRPPHWPDLPAAPRFGRLWQQAPATAMAAVRANAEAIGLMLSAVGISVNCMPLLDLAAEGTHPVIAQRAFGSDPLCIAALGRAAIAGLGDAGVVGVVKHIPGQGRAHVDSHGEVPIVTASADELTADTEPFRLLADAPMAMTAHVTYVAWDAEACATMSARVIGTIIRGAIGFDGLLMTDALEMAALSGTMADRARRALAAGVDLVLHCTGDLAEMAEIAEAVDREMQLSSLRRLERAMKSTVRPTVPQPDALADALARRDALMAAATEDLRG